MAFTYVAFGKPCLYSGFRIKYSNNINMYTFSVVELFEDSLCIQSKLRARREVPQLRPPDFVKCEPSASFFFEILS